MRLPKVLQATVERFRELFPKGKVVRCKKFNRRSCWEWLDIRRWWESIRMGANINPLIYIDIESCMEHCRKLGKNADYLYYSNYHNQGYTYITIEGGNRHDATHDFYDSEEENRKDKHVNYCIIKSVDRETMHDLYCRLAYGKAPNRQEQRTGIFGTISDLVRKKAETLAVMWNKINGIKQSRMQDDELVAQIMSYVTFNSFGKSNGHGNKDDSLDAMYKGNNYKKQPFNYVIKELKEIFDAVVNLDTVTKKLPKTFVYLLVIVLEKFNKNYKIEDYDDFIEEFHTIYTDKMNESVDDLEKKGEKRKAFLKGQTWLPFSELTKGLVLNSDQLNHMISLLSEDFLPVLEEKGIISPINEEEFTYKHRKEYIRLNKFEKNGQWWIQIRSNNSSCTLIKDEPEFKEVTLAEAYSAKCELDHITPKSKKGETTIKNAELTTKEYNRKKSNKENV